jgi:hypothetical protein
MYNFICIYVYLYVYVYLYIYTSNKLIGILKFISDDEWQRRVRFKYIDKYV